MWQKSQEEEDGKDAPSLAIFPRIIHRVKGDMVVLV